MKMRYVTKDFNYRSCSRRTKPSESLFRFSIMVYNQLDKGKIDRRTLNNFKKALMRIVGSEKGYDGYIYYPIDTFKTLDDLAGQIHYCSDRWCAGRALSVVAAIDLCLNGLLPK